MSKRVAAIDIGTNSIHLVIAELTDAGFLNVITSEKDSVQLGKGPEGELAPDAVQRALEALKRQVQLATDHQADVTAFATSAVREARNRDEFIQLVTDLVGLEIQTIVGREEARLIHLGVSQGLELRDKRALIFDIGGGSTEFVVSINGKAEYLQSVKLGAIRLTKRFFPGGEITPETFVQARSHIRDVLLRVRPAVVGNDIDSVVASSGTAEAMAEAVLYLDRTSVANRRIQVTRDQIENVCDLLVRTPVDERRSRLGLADNRIDIIAGGAALLIEILDSFELDHMMTSEYALREGMVFELLGSAGSTRSDLKLASAAEVSQQRDPDPAHARNIARLSTRLFDQLKELHGFDDHERQLLEAASLLHNIGVSISRDGHHKHSEYLIRNSELITGYTEQERDMVALIARFHRKKLPFGSAEVAHLGDENKRRIYVLSGLLRVAVGLDRGRRGAVDDVEVEVDGQDVLLTAIADQDLETEIYAANALSGVLAEAIDRNILVVARARS